MKKILATILAAAAIGAGVPVSAETSADVLVWYVDTSAASDGGQNAVFDEIKFWAVNSSNDKVLGLGGLTYSDPEKLLAKNYSDLVGRNGTLTDPNGGEIINAFGRTWAGTYYTDVSGFNDNGYSFLMELYNGGQAVDWMVQPISLAEIQQASGIFHLSDLNLKEIETGYNFGGRMVPEPTSGLLLLVGGALLALRRRRCA